MRSSRGAVIERVGPTQAVRGADRGRVVAIACARNLPAFG